MIALQVESLANVEEVRENLRSLAHCMEGPPFSGAEVKNPRGICHDLCVRMLQICAHSNMEATHKDISALQAEVWDLYFATLTFRAKFEDFGENTAPQAPPSAPEASLSSPVPAPTASASFDPALSDQDDRSADRPSQIV